MDVDQATAVADAVRSTMTPSTSTYLLLGVLRTVYFLGCRRYVHRSLLSDIRQAIHDDRDAHQTTDAAARGGAGQSAQSGLRAPVLEDEDEDSGFDTPTPLTSAQSTSAGPSGYPWMGSGKSAEAIPMRNRAPSGGASPKEGDASSAGHAAKARAGKRRKWASSAGYSRGASLVFCWAFCEGSLLFSLVLLGGVLEPTARRRSWTLSLGLMLALIVVIAPLAECLLLSLTLSRTATERPKLLGTRMLVLTLVPFTLYLFAFYRVGSMLQNFLGIETGSHHFDLYNTTLARICVPGVFLIASLSGGGAMNTAWENWEWRRREKAAPITEEHLAFADQALSRARADHVARLAELERAKAAQASGEDGGTTSKGGLLGMLTGGGKSRVTQLEQEVAGLKLMEQQMVRDMGTMHRRKARREYSRTVQGAALALVNSVFSLYCVYRILMSCVNIIFGYSRQLPSSDSSPSSATTPTDIMTWLVARLFRSMSIELDIALTARLFGLALLGGIIAVNMRAVLRLGTRVFKATSIGVSSSLMLLAMAQLLGIYLLTCLISLPSSAARSTEDDESAVAAKTDSLLTTLPSFQIFTRLFDLVFLSTALATLVVRWLRSQIGSGTEDIAPGGFGSAFGEAVGRFGRSEGERHVV